MIPPIGPAAFLIVLGVAYILFGASIASVPDNKITYATGWLFLIAGFLHLAWGLLGVIAWRA